MDQPVPVNELLSALKDTGNGQVLVIFTMWVATLPLMTYPKSSMYSGKLNLQRTCMRDNLTPFISVENDMFLCGKTYLLSFLSMLLVDPAVPLSSLAWNCFCTAMAFSFTRSRSSSIWSRLSYYDTHTRSTFAFICNIIFTKLQ